MWSSGRVSDPVDRCSSGAPVGFELVVPCATIEPVRSEPVSSPDFGDERLEDVESFGDYGVWEAGFDESGDAFAGGDFAWDEGEDVAGDEIVDFEGLFVGDVDERGPLLVGKVEDYSHWGSTSR